MEGILEFLSLADKTLIFVWTILQYAQGMPIEKRFLNQGKVPLSSHIFILFNLNLHLDNTFVWYYYLKNAHAMRGLTFECLFLKKTTTTQQLITCTVMTILLYYLTLPSSHHLSGNLFSASPSIHFPSRVGDIETFESKPPITGHCKLAWQSSRQAFMLVGDLESPYNLAGM